jgi:uncharacterized protein (TIGR03032 family)
MSQPVDEPTLPTEPTRPQREIRYEHSPGFIQTLERLNTSLLVSTYQAGKLVVVGVDAGELVLAFRNFEQAMGIAVSPRQIAVGTAGSVWVMRRTSGIAPSIEPAGRYDACFITRRAHVTGEIDGHEMAWGGADGQELWMVNTLFSCLCTVDEDHSFLPRWRPRFISSLASEDRCHLNGMAFVDGQPKFVTAMSETDTKAGWRPTKATSGVIIEVESNQVVRRGLAMPHAPRWHQGQLWALDSGRGQLIVVDPIRGTHETVAEMPGYTRGMAMAGDLAFIGLSKIRETSTFGGLPLEERRSQLKCGVGIVHLPTGRHVAHLEFCTGVEEIFDVQLMPGIRCPAVVGPFPKIDDTPTIWTVPASARG